MKIVLAEEVITNPKKYINCHFRLPKTHTTEAAFYDSPFKKTQNLYTVFENVKTGQYRRILLSRKLVIIE